MTSLFLVMYNAKSLYFSECTVKKRLEFGSLLNVESKSFWNWINAWSSMLGLLLWRFQITRNKRTTVWFLGKKIRSPNSKDTTICDNKHSLRKVYSNACWHSRHFRHTIKTFWRRREKRHYKLIYKWNFRSPITNTRKFAIST